MAKKLIQGDKLPNITLRLTNGASLTLPEELPGRYLALLFYRGHWCPYCLRHLVSYQAKLDELASLGITVIAASVDQLEPTLEMMKKTGITFPVAYGVSAEDVAEFDPWFGDDNHGHYIQPMELLALRGGTVFGAVYATGPIGRMDVEEVLNSVRNRERRRLEQQQSQPAAPTR